MLNNKQNVAWIEQSEIRDVRGISPDFGLTAFIRATRGLTDE